MSTRALCLIALASTAAACATPTAVEDGAEGTYVLYSVNRKPIPYALSSTEAGTVRIEQRQILLDGRGGFTDRVEIGLLSSGELDVLRSRRDGRYDVTSGGVTLYYEGKPTAHGLMDGATLWLTDGGMLFELER